MLTQQIISLINTVRNGGQSAPLLLSEAHASDVCNSIFELDIVELDELIERGVMDFLYYDCADREAGNHKADILRKHSEKLYQKPAGDIFVALYRNIDALTDTSANALLRLFEDVPTQLLIIVTSFSPAKIISTLQSRMLLIDASIDVEKINPHQAAIDTFIAGDARGILAMTLAPAKEYKFTREDALWIVRGLQDAITCGTLDTRHSHCIAETRIALETTNTIAKYLIDQLIISIVCE